jgi:hypothetical protein
MIAYGLSMVLLWLICGVFTIYLCLCMMSREHAGIFLKHTLTVGTQVLKVGGVIALKVLRRAFKDLASLIDTLLENGKAK